MNFLEKFTQEKKLAFLKEYGFTYKENAYLGYFTSQGESISHDVSVCLTDGTVEVTVETYVSDMPSIQKDSFPLLDRYTQEEVVWHTLNLINILLPNNLD